MEGRSSKGAQLALAHASPPPQTSFSEVPGGLSTNAVQLADASGYCRGSARLSNLPAGGRSTSA